MKKNHRVHYGDLPDCLRDCNPRVRRHAHNQGAWCQMLSIIIQVVRGASHRDQSRVIDMSALHIARFFSIYLQGTPTDYLSQKQLNRILFFKNLYCQ